MYIYTYIYIHHTPPNTYNLDLCSLQILHTKTCKNKIRKHMHYKLPLLYPFASYNNTSLNL